MLIQVNGLSGPLCEVFAKPTWTLGRLHQEIERKTGIPVDKQCLAAVTVLQRSPLQAEWLATVQRTPNQIASAPDEIKECAEVVLAAVRHGKAKVIEHAGPMLRSDGAFFANAIELCGVNALAYAAENILSDQGVILKAIERSGADALFYASKTLLSNQDFIVRVLGEQEWEVVIPLIGQKLLADRTFVTKAIELCGADVLRDASEEIRSDNKFLLAAIELDYKVFEYASDPLRSDCTFVLEALQRCPYLFSKLEENGCDLEERVDMAFPVGRALLADRTFVAKAIERGGAYVVKHATEEVKSDRQFLLDAIEHDCNVFSYASYSLRSDRTFVLEALQRHPSLFCQCDIGDFDEDRGVVLEAVRMNWEAFQFTKARFRGDREIVLAAARQDTRTFEYGGSQFIDDMQPNPKRRKTEDEEKLLGIP